MVGGGGDVSGGRQRGGGGVCFYVASGAQVYTVKIMSQFVIPSHSLTCYDV